MTLMNKSVTEYTPRTYAGCAGQVCRVDCSLGVNMEKMPTGILENLRNISEEKLQHYPHSEEIFESLLNKLQKFNPTLSKGNLALGCGSINVLLNLNTLFINDKKMVLGYAPQFSAYVDDVHFRGAKYIGIPLKKEENYKIDVEEICRCIIKYRPDLLYLDNPNNPTGQVLDKDQVIKICKTADSIDAAVIVDEAYGEYMPASNSMVTEVNKLNGLVVVRTMSKGYGLPGIRMGYAVASSEIIEQLNKLIVPFNANSIARELTTAMLAEERDFDALMELTVSKIKRLREAVGDKIKIAATSESTPISLFYVEDESLDLTRLFADNGIAVVSGASFENLSINSARLMVPAEEEVSLLCELIKQLAQEI